MGSEGAGMEARRHRGRRRDAGGGTTAANPDVIHAAGWPRLLRSSMTLTQCHLCCGKWVVGAIFHIICVVVLACCQCFVAAVGSNFTAVTTATHYPPLACPLFMWLQSCTQYEDVGLGRCARVRMASPQAGAAESSVPFSSLTSNALNTPSAWSPPPLCPSLH